MRFTFYKYSAINMNTLSFHIYSEFPHQIMINTNVEFRKRRLWVKYKWIKPNNIKVIFYILFEENENPEFGQ